MSKGFLEVIYRSLHDASGASIHNHNQLKKKSEHDNWCGMIYMYRTMLIYMILIFSHSACAITEALDRLVVIFIISLWGPVWWVGCNWNLACLSKSWEALWGHLEKTTFKESLSYTEYLQVKFSAAKTSIHQDTKQMHAFYPNPNKYNTFHWS